MSKRWIHIIIFFLSGYLLMAQDSPKRIIQFTGVVFTMDSSAVVPGVHIYVPKAGRGTITNPYGFFSLPVLEGDSVVFSAVGFKRASYVIPEHEGDQSLKVVVALEEDVTFLEDVEVFPYPSEAMFKEAVLSVALPDQRDFDNLNAWLSQDYMTDAYWNVPASPGANHRYFMQQQMRAIEYKFQAPRNNLLNPWAWAQTINSLKRGN